MTIMERARALVPTWLRGSLEHVVPGTGAILNLSNAKPVIMRYLGAAGPSNSCTRPHFRFTELRGQRTTRFGRSSAKNYGGKYGPNLGTVFGCGSSAYSVDHLGANPSTNVGACLGTSGSTFGANFSLNNNTSEMCFAIVGDNGPGLTPGVAWHPNYRAGRLYTATLLLPKWTHVAATCGCPFPSKDLAARSACLEASKKLLKTGALGPDLRPAGGGQGRGGRGHDVIERRASDSDRGVSEDERHVVTWAEPAEWEAV